MPAAEPAGDRAETGAGRDWRSYGLLVARWGLALLWLVWAGLAWWTAPRPVDPAQARADIAADRVTSVVRAETWEARQGFWGSRVRMPRPKDRRRAARLDHDVRAAALHGAGEMGDPADLIGFGGSGHRPETDRLATELRAAEARSSGATFEPRGAGPGRGRAWPCFSLWSRWPC